jgi:hypothetical protein
MNAYRPDQICIGLVRAPCIKVRQVLQAQLERTIKSETFNSRLEQAGWREFFERHGLLYDVKRFQIALFSPNQALTVYVCNLADGWISLYGNTVIAGAFDAYFFRATLSDRADYAVFEMKAWRDGALVRELRVRQDDIGWGFLNKGEPMSFESTQQYRSRRISERLDRETIERSVTEFDGKYWRFFRTA